MPIAASPDSPVVRRLATLLVGLVLVGVGVGLTIAAEIGVAPYDVLTTGLAARTGLPLGVAAMTTPAVFVVLGWRLGRRPGPGTLVAVLLVGPILGATAAALPEVEAMPVRLAFFVIGFFLLTAGITAVVVAETGPGPAELVMLAIHEKGYPLAPVRTGIELTCVALGWALGGQVGAGTAAVAILIGITLRTMLTAAGYTPSHAAKASDAAAPGA